MKVKRRLWAALTGMLMTTLIGTAGFQMLEGLNFFDALWMTVITLLTVGYGDLYPLTMEGKVFALIIIPVGIGLVAYALGVVAAGIIEGEFSEEVVRRRMEKAIENLQGHIIICGLGRVGLQVAEQLENAGTPFVIIECDQKQLEELDSDMLYIQGDATEDDTLLKAGIKRASGLITTLPQDADNVFITLTAKGLNRDIQVVARVEKSGSEEKLRRAGADKVINPSNISGRRMALSILKPTSVDYVDTILHHQHGDFAIEELEVSESSQLAGKTLAELRIRSDYGVTVVAIKRGDQFISNPSADEILKEHDRIIAMGTLAQLEHLESEAR
ncbi:MAG: potassium channel protein [Bacillaceae bacterium]|nr:potassium channel protein [Bacillaceae bacterium]